MDVNKRSISEVENNDFISLENFSTLNIELITKEELESIANTLGVSYDLKCNKIDIYDNIIKFLKFKDNVKKFKNQNENQETNPFNKYYSKLVVDNENSKELVFWKVFRNKYIYKRIFSNFKLSNVRSYVRLFDIKYIINNYTNYESIIKDKIKSKKNISKGILFIFTSIRKCTNENSQFYHQLFTNYSSKFEFQKNINKYLLAIFKTANLVAYNEFIKVFNINTTLIITPFFKLYYQKSPCIFSSINNYKHLKFLIYHLENRQYLYEDTFKFNLKYYVDMALTIISFCHYESKSNVESISLKKLIKLINIQSKLVNMIDSDSKKNDVNNISTYPFTQFELDTSYLSLFTCSKLINSYRHQQILNLIQKVFNYYLNFNGQVTSEDTLYNLKENWSIKYDLNYIEIIEYTYNYIYSSLANHVPNSQETKYELFFEFVSNLIKFTNSENSIFHVLLSVIRLNDYNLLYCLHSNFKESIEPFYDKITYKALLLNSIKHDSMLIYYFFNYKTMFFSFKNNYLWQFVFDKNIMLCYQNLMKSIRCGFLIESYQPIEYLPQFEPYYSKSSNIIILECIYNCKKYLYSYYKSQNLNWGSFLNIINNNIKTCNINDFISFTTFNFITPLDYRIYDFPLTSYFNYLYWMGDSLGRLTSYFNDTDFDLYNSIATISIPNCSKVLISNHQLLLLLIYKEQYKSAVKVFVTLCKQNSNLFISQNSILVYELPLDFYLELLNQYLESVEIEIQMQMENETCKHIKSIFNTLLESLVYKQHFELLKSITTKINLDNKYQNIFSNKVLNLLSDIFD